MLFSRPHIPKVPFSVGHLHRCLLHFTWFFGTILCSIRNCISIASAVFGRPFVKRFALCYRTVVLSVLFCDVGVLWPNGWIDQNKTWHGGRPQPLPHCVTCLLPKRDRGPQFWPMSVVMRTMLLPHKGAQQPPNFRPMYCGQTAGCINMPLETEVGLGPGHIVLDGDPAPLLHPKGLQPPNFL